MPKKSVVSKPAPPHADPVAVDSGGELKKQIGMVVRAVTGLESSVNCLAAKLEYVIGNGLLARLESLEPPIVECVEIDTPATSELHWIKYRIYAIENVINELNRIASTSI